MRLDLSRLALAVPALATGMFLLCASSASARASTARRLPVRSPANVAAKRRARMTCSLGGEVLAPCTSSQSVQVGVQFSTVYTFTNNTLDPLNISPSVAKPSVLSTCSFTPTSVSVPSHQSKPFTLKCTGGSDGTGTVTVTADEVTATVSVTVKSLNVTPKGTVVNATPSAVNKQIFTVQNLGASTDTVDLVTACLTYSCTLQTPSPLVVSGGSSKSDTVQYTAGAVGTQGTIRLVGTVRHFTTTVDTGSVTAQVPSPLPPVISLTPHNGDNHLVGLCVAACFDVMASYSTPSYTSMDTPRSATLVYSSAQAHPMGLITVDVTDPSVRHSQKLSIQLRQSNGSAVTFTNGSTELFFSQDSAVLTRLTGQFDATSLATGVQLDTVIVKSYWTTGADAGTVTQNSFPAPVLLVNEQSSPFGAGWTLGGLQRIYFPSDSTQLLVTDGTGSITRFTGPCPNCLESAVAADFSTLIRTQSGSTVTGYRRTYRDGSTAIFNPAGYLTSTENRFVDTTKYAYDGSNHIQTITDPAGKVLTFAYTSGKLTSITDPNSRVSTFSVNGSGDLASITDPTSTLTFQGTYNAQHRLTQSTDRGSNTWKFVYDFAGKLGSDSTPSVAVDTSITGTGTLLTRRLGHKMVSLESVELIDPASGKGSSATPGSQVLSAKVRAVSYGMPLETTLAHTTRYALDRFLAPIQVEQDSVADTTFLTRDANEHVTRSSERRKRQTVASDSAVYSGPRLTKSISFLTGAVINYAYDTTYDLVQRVTGTTQTVQNYLNTTKSRIDSTRVGSNPDSTKDSVSSVRYDSRNRVIVGFDPKKDSSKVFISAAGFQNTDSVLAQTRVTRFGYDGWGRLVRTVNPRGDTVVLGLDKLNRTDTVTGPGARMLYAFDALGRTSQITDPKGQVYKYHYNAIGWADTVTDAATSDPSNRRYDAYEFTKAGAVRLHVNRDTLHTWTTYDHQGRDSTVKLQDGRITTFAYDPAGLWMAVANGESIDTVRTDSLGLVQTQTSVRGTNKYIVTATTDANGLLRSRVFTMGTDTTSLQRITYGYDAEWRLDTLSVGTQRTYFGYNADGILAFVKLTRPSGALLDSTAYKVTGVHKGYSVTHSASSLVRFSNYYTRDTLEHITARTTAAGDTAWTYAYNALGRLTNYSTLYYSGGETCVPDPHVMDGERCTGSPPATLQTTAFTYDSVGNRTDGGPTLIAGNRLSIWNGDTLTYDYDGNLTRKKTAGWDQYLYWNSIGQLDSVKTNGSLVSFGYNGVGRRVRKSVGSVVVYKYVYDGDQILTIDSLGTRARTYSYYPGVDRPHSVVTNAGARYYYVTEIGATSVVGIIDTTGAILNRYQYAPFGTSETAKDSIANPFKYTGREYDPETQLYFYRARYYDPSLARFVSEDPIGQNGGANQYSYANDNPINTNDPSGMLSAELMESYYQMVCARAPKTDSSCHWGGGGGGGAFGDVSGAVSLGWGFDEGKSWGSWESSISPARCSNFGIEHCAELHQAIGRLQDPSGGKQCQSLGDDAAFRLYNGSLVDQAQVGNRAGKYMNHDMVLEKLGVFAAAEYDDLIVLYPIAFDHGLNYLTFVLGHEEAHAVFGLGDAYDDKGAEIVDSRNPASAVSLTCQGYYDNAHQ